MNNETNVVMTEEIKAFFERVLIKEDKPKHEEVRGDVDERN